jgi:hypothetical protein
MQHVGRDITGPRCTDCINFEVAGPGADHCMVRLSRSLMMAQDCFDTYLGLTSVQRVHRPSITAFLPYSRVLYYYTGTDFKLDSKLSCIDERPSPRYQLIDGCKALCELKTVGSPNPAREARLRAGPGHTCNICRRRPARGSGTAYDVRAAQHCMGLLSVVTIM